MKFILSVLLLFTSGVISAQSSGITTYCNPMDINYQYNFEQLNQKIAYRSGADPVIVNHKGEYYLFVTISGGYWHSKDLLHWNYITPTKWPMEDICAPAALSVRDTLYLFQSTFEKRPIFFTTTPENGKLHFYNRLLPQLPEEVGPWDPDIFFDEATNSLDANNETVIMKNLATFFENRTVVVVAHRLSTVKNADQIIVLDNGSVAESGNHSELSSKRGKY